MLICSMSRQRAVVASLRETEVHVLGLIHGACDLPRFGIKKADREPGEI
jgi:hypothetical protein